MYCLTCDGYGDEDCNTCVEGYSVFDDDNDGFGNCVSNMPCNNYYLFSKSKRKLINGIFSLIVFCLSLMLVCIYKKVFNCLCFGQNNTSYHKCFLEYHTCVYCNKKQIFFRKVYS